MGGTDPAGADRHGADHDGAAVHAEQVGHAGADPDDVGDRVEGADLVEGHVVGGVVVHRALGGRQPREDPGGPLTHRLVEVGRGEQAAYVVPGAVGGAVGDLDVAPGGAQAGPVDPLDAQGDRLGGDRVDGALQHLDRHAGADQGAEQHVAAGPGGGVDPEAHGCSPGAARVPRGALCRAIRAASTPAP